MLNLKMDSLKDESKLLKQLVDTLLYCGDTHIHTLLNLICNNTNNNNPLTTKPTVLNRYMAT